jgi:elongation factor G
MSLKITVPDSFTGDVIGDLNTKRGRVLGMIPQDGMTVIEAEAPMAEIVRYAVDLRSLTQGRGSFTTQFVRYDEVPSHITQKVVEKAQKSAS